MNLEKMGLKAPTATKTGTTISGVVFKARLQVSSCLRGVALSALFQLLTCSSLRPGRGGARG